MTARLTIEYDGTEFVGWAAQPGQRTVQGELERALATVLRREAPLTVAGRTDAGVHAWRQVASYDGEPARPDSLNALLPDDIAVLECVTAAPGFDARRDATSRAYCYRVLARPGRPALARGRALHWPNPVDVGRLDECASGARRHPRLHRVHADRDVSRALLARRLRRQLAGWARPGSRPPRVLDRGRYVHAPHEPGSRRDDARGRGRPALNDFAQLLEGRPRTQAGPTAPAHGLYFAGAGYRGERLISSPPPGRAGR